MPYSIPPQTKVDTSTVDLETVDTSTIDSDTVSASAANTSGFNTNFQDTLQENLINEITKTSEELEYKLEYKLQNKLKEISRDLDYYIAIVEDKVKEYKTIAINNINKYKLFVILYFGIIFISSCLTIFSSVKDLLRFIFRKKIDR